ncbi:MULTISPECIES: acyl-CoA dehydrogenase family protein [unclassified Azospirillum]|uniref:acyl-CoA dehydrogenase family protein n=1 Tax=unclassified Azospirillum TaxID=2630922 RepID=UPI000B68F43C|nr:MULTISPECIES: acyl-CoA dehydrogenase family protein [unclassified Azospirillum]SNT08250.1 acyl-CoA dehydrogenase [Azospirillum sp. RU38E]SNT22817.1 acyl-CoA dehydrogenase [Azospirillum sp. RU37A]
MDLELTSDQRAIHDAIVQMVSNHMDVPRSGATLKPVEYCYADQLDRDLAEGEFFSLALTEGCGALEAALLVYETGRSPLVLETAGAAFIGPLLTGRDLPRPVAVARLEDLTRAVRFLDRARTLIVDLGDDVAVLSTDGLAVEPIHSMFAYPLGRLMTLPDFTAAERLGAAAVPRLRRLWRVGLALETAAALQAAVDFTTAYVKDRLVFGRPVGSYQAVQHRLSADIQRVRAVYWLALKAAWSGGDQDAALAALYAQQAITPINYDTHQFNGALGMTLEHTLHFWTFRLRLLQGEMGGARTQAAATVAATWAGA